MHLDEARVTLRSVAATASRVNRIVWALEDRGRHARIGPVADEELAHLHAIAADPSRWGDVASSCAAARVHLARLEALLVESAQQAADDCVAMADRLARGAEWSLDGRDSETQRIVRLRRRLIYVAGSRR